MINPGVVATIRVVGVRGDPCGAMRWTVSVQHAIEKEPKKYINELIVGTEVAILQLDPKLQSNFRYLAAKQIKHTLKSIRHNVFHKRLQYNINKIKKIMENNDLALVNADKSKAMVIIDKNLLKEKVNNFIKENHISMLNKDPTEVCQKQIHQAIKKCNALIDK